VVQGQPGQIVTETPISKATKEKWIGGMKKKKKKKRIEGTNQVPLLTTLQNSFEFEYSFQVK
jgi:hypothetical protein